MKKLGFKEEKERINKIEKLLTKNPEIILVHVTDTYFIEESRINNEVDLPGFARFRSLVNHIKSNPTVQKNKIPVFVLHGGDFLYPSLMSVYFQGRQMVEILNICGFDYCTLGNHDFDGGIKYLKERMSEALFEIVCTNIKVPKKNSSLQISDYVICKDKHNLPFAAITGIVGKDTLRKARQSSLGTDPIELSLKQIVVNIQKNYPKINHLIILSHMSNEEDVSLERWLDRNWDGYVYLLGGHDHNEALQYSDENPKSILLKGQSNCRTVQIIGIPRFLDFKKTSHLPEHVVVMNSTGLSKFHPESEIQKKVRRWEFELEKHLDEPKSDRIVKQFKANTILDATELQLRKGSTNFGNFIADCVQDFANSDIALINSGHFRGDRKLGNILRPSHLRRIFVLDKKEALVKITMTGKECREFLNHA
jgi:2',3'-cyclic-nucleotide 2'-phosphodiesterase (5'-nucleotidase family)